jgi:anti-repressor protein
LLLAAQQQEQIEAQEKQLTLQAPKVQYYDEVLQSQGLIAANVIAKELGMSAVTLNRKLNEKGVIYRCSGTWVFYHRYQDRGYGKLKTHPYVDSHGVQRTAESLYYTESGRAFIHQIMKSCA